MKNILSISVGSSSRDHTTRHVFLGQECELSRQGTDGDFEKAVQRYADMDGKVDAFGVGGVEFFLRVGKKRYYLNADLTLGLRYDDLVLSGARWVPPLGDLQSGIQPYENKGSELLPRLRAAWRASDQLSLSLSAGDALAAPRPSFERVCCGAVVLGNADVKPETSRNYLLEADISPAAWLKIRPSLFRNETTNYIQKIVWALFPNYVFSYTQVNYPDVTIQGAELSAEMRFWDRLSISLNGSWLESEAEPVGVSFSFYGQNVDLFDLTKGGAIPMLPKSQGAAVVRWDDPRTGFEISAQAQYTGSMFIQRGVFGIGIGSQVL